MLSLAGTAGIAIYAGVVLNELPPILPWIGRPGKNQNSGLCRDHRVREASTSSTRKPRSAGQGGLQNIRLA